MIPKTIHYCWFGGNPLPDLAKKCIRSWKKNCKGFEIIEWNESNFDITSAPLYVRQAYEAKKWAFVTDYVRLWAMTEHGGIYMDTDVEVIKPLDAFLTHQAFSGFEDDTKIPTGIMACEEGFALFVELLNHYSNISFYNEDGSPNLTTNVVLITDICLSKGLKQNNTFQIIDGFAIYPKDFFCPKSYADGIIRKTKNTYTIHHFNASWHTEQERKEHQYKIEQRKLKEKKKRKKIRKNRIKGIIISIIGEDLYKKIRKPDQ